MGPQGSFASWEEPATVPYPKPDESNLQRAFLFAIASRFRKLTHSNRYRGNAAGALTFRDKVTNAWSYTFTAQYTWRAE
jgi:ABC-type uncharacterized transport system YnjBCD substrate-binding protein